MAAEAFTCNCRILGSYKKNITYSVSEQLVKHLSKVSGTLKKLCTQVGI